MPNDKIFLFKKVNLFKFIMNQWTDFQNNNSYGESIILDETSIMYIDCEC